MADFNDNFINYSFERNAEGRNIGLGYKDDIAFGKSNSSKKRSRFIEMILFCLSVLF